MSSRECTQAVPRPASTPIGPVAAAPGSALLGRRREIAELRALAHGAFGKAGGALVLRGEAGTGKSALLADLSRFTERRPVLWLTGIEAEREMAWAGLHRLLLALPAELGRLPGAQREAVDAAVGIGDGATTDPGLVESAVLAVLADAAGEAGLLCIVDDLQWIDRESLAVLQIIARHAREIPLVLVAAVCEPESSPVLADVHEFTVTGLEADAGADLLTRHAGAVLDRRTAEQLALLAGGNPLALSETGRLLADGRADVLDILWSRRLPGLSLPGRFTAEIGALPTRSRALLALAACDISGDTRRFWRAASALGLSPEALDPARRARVVLPGPGIPFRHPLLRAAALDLAPPAEWRAAHHALATACDQQAEPDTHAWHQAAAAAVPDEKTAARLAHRAQQTASGHDPLWTASWLARAAQLSATEAAAEHYLAAGEAALAASAPRLADDLLRQARLTSGSSAQQARAQRLTARLNSVLGRQTAESGHTMLISASRLAVGDRRAGLEAMQEAAQLALLTGRYTRGTTPPAMGSALLHMAAEEIPGPPAGMLLPGLATLLSGDYQRAAPLLRQALRAGRFSRDGLPGATAARVYAARALWEHEYLLPSYGPAAQPAPPAHARTGTSDHDQAVALACWSAALTSVGHLDEAYWLIVHARRLGRSIGWSEALLATLNDAELWAWRGDGPATHQAISRQTAAAAELERADAENSATAALMTWHLSRCRYSEAFAAAEQLSTADVGGYSNQALHVLVEAGIRLGRRAAAQRAFGILESRASASGTAWALGVLAECEALLDDDSAAAGAYERSIALLDTTGVISERARARLLYGEWLRRKRRRSAARGWLSAAGQLFSRMGAAEFVRRAQRELDVTLPPGGQRSEVSSRSTGPRLTLTERRVAELAAAGATNKEIAAELFLSRRTVDHHLRNTYGKLGVSSRRELATALPSGAPAHSGSQR